MKNRIYSHRWDTLEGDEIVALFYLHFPEVAIQPNMTIVQDLRRRRTAELLLLENRTASTVYQIRQTGVVYQICQPNGDCFTYDSYQEYLADDPVDELIEAYNHKAPKFTASEQNGLIIVRHNEPPEFTGTWIGCEVGVTDITWIDQPSTDIMALARLMKSLGAFMNSYFRKKKNRQIK